MKLTNEEIAKVFALYLYCEYKVKVPIEKDNSSYKGVNSLETISTALRHGFYDVGYQLRLTPLSKISDEHAIEVAKIIDFHSGKGCMVQRGEDYITVSDKYNDYVEDRNTLFIYHDVYEIWSKDDYGNIYEYDLCRLSFVHQYLISKGYSVPLFFGTNHPCNCKTAIELEIAIDKTLLTLPV